MSHDCGWLGGRVKGKKEKRIFQHKFFEENSKWKFGKKKYIIFE